MGRIQLRLWCRCLLLVFFEALRAGLQSVGELGTDCTSTLAVSDVTGYLVISAWSSAMDSIFFRVLSGRMITILPSDDQHCFIPKCLRHDMKTLCLDFVRNSDIVIPDPFKEVLLSHTRRRWSMSVNLTRTGRVVAREDPSRWHTVMLSDFTSVTFIWLHIRLCTDSYSFSFGFSASPWISKIFLRMAVSCLSILSDNKSNCDLNIDSVWQTKDLNSKNSRDSDAMSWWGGWLPVATFWSLDSYWCMRDSKNFVISSRLFARWVSMTVVMVYT